MPETLARTIEFSESRGRGLKQVIVGLGLREAILCGVWLAGHSSRETLDYMPIKSMTSKFGKTYIGRRPSTAGAQVG